MNVTCEYCKSACESGAIKCRNCGAPLSGEAPATSDYRSCPYCRRKLLALGSPACNYCGRRLPDDYINAREADLRRIGEIEEGDKKGGINAGVDEAIRQAARSKKGESSSLADLLNIKNLTDLFR